MPRFSFTGLETMPIARRNLQGMIFAAFLSGAALCLAAQTTAPAGSAPGTATVQLTPHYAPNATYTYDLEIDSHILRSGAGAGNPAELINASRVLMHVLPAAQQQGGGAVIELSFLQYNTTVRADASLQEALQKETSETDESARQMAPVRVQLQPDGTTKIVERPQGAVFDQPVAVLEQFARTDMLPIGPVAVGTHWKRTRIQDLPTMHFSLPLQMQCTLTGVQAVKGQPAATIAVQMQGASPLPPDGIPNAQQLAAAGLVARGSIDITGSSNNQYRETDGVLLSSSSQNHNVLKIQLMGATPEPQDVTTTIDSTGTVKLIAEKR